MKPTIGRIVIYRSRTGNYDIPAIVNCTTTSIARKGLEAYEATDGKLGVPPLSSDTHVHLTVLTPGKPQQRTKAKDFKVESEHGRSENIAGCYQEWDIPFYDGEAAGSEADCEPGTWRWPERVA